MPTEPKVEVYVYTYGSRNATVLSPSFYIAKLEEQDSRTFVTWPNASIWFIDYTQIFML